MRLLADENIPGLLVHRLRERGHDVAWIIEVAAGMPDSEILKRAADEGRIVLTADKDFGELVFRSGHPIPAGVILLRLPSGDPTELTERACRVIESRADWEGHFSVIESDRLRMSPLVT